MLLIWYQIWRQIIFKREEESLACSLLSIICRQIWYQINMHYIDRALVTLCYIYSVVWFKGKALTLKGVILKFKEFISMFGGVDHKWLQIIGAPPPEAADVDRRQGKDYTSSGFTERCKICIILAPKISYYCTLMKKKVLRFFQKKRSRQK